MRGGTAGEAGEACDACRLAPSRASFEVPDIRAFDLKSTLDCGQAFRWRRVAGDSPDRRFCYVGVVEGKRIRVSAAPAPPAVPAGPTPWRVTLSLEVCGCAGVEEARSLVGRYFRLESDHEAIERRLTRIDPVMRIAVGYGRGLRILRQDPWECLVSYVMSSVNRVERIAGSVEKVCSSCARPGLDVAGGAPCFAPFPDAERLCAMSVEDMAGCGLGFRARYVLAAAEAVATGALDLTELSGLGTEQARARLLELPGVGRKVADCALLFGYGRTDVFPNDVWIGRAVSDLYFRGKRLTAGEVQGFAARHFGDLAGYAQEYLYNYARGTGLRGIPQAGACGLAAAGASGAGDASV